MTPVAEVVVVFIVLGLAALAYLRHTASAVLEDGATPGSDSGGSPMRCG